MSDREGRVLEVYCLPLCLCQPCVVTSVPPPHFIEEDLQAERKVSNVQASQYRLHFGITSESPAFLIKY